MGVDEEGTLARLRAHRRALVDPKIEEHHGRIVKTTGDGVLVEFASVVDAVRCAVKVERGMAKHNACLPPQRRIEFRVGINLGDIIVQDNDIFGGGVNVAARLEALAEPGGICVSQAARDQVRDKPGVTFEDIGEQAVKNIARPIHTYRFRFEGVEFAYTAPERRRLAALDCGMRGLACRRQRSGVVRHEAGNRAGRAPSFDRRATVRQCRPWLRAGVLC
jgi:adenylate cyclase